MTWSIGRASLHLHQARTSFTQLHFPINEDLDNLIFDDNHNFDFDDDHHLNYDDDDDGNTDGDRYKVIELQ